MKDQQMFGPLPPVPVPSSTPPEASGGGGSGVTPERDREALDQEKRLRREIANSNERRRMQSINAGFQSLRNLLPHHEGEKLSKAAILQQTAEYIHQLEQDKTRLMAQNSQLMKRFNSSSSSSGSTANNTNGAPAGNPSGDAPSSSTNVFSSPHSPAGDTPPAIIKRRKTLDGSVESADEGIGSMSPDHNGEEYRNEVVELRRETFGLRQQLERERKHRLDLEDSLNGMRREHYPHEQQEQLEQQQQHHQQQIIEPQIVYVQQQPAPPPPQLQPKYEQHERMQTAEESEAYHRVSTPARNSYDDYRVRHNLNSIVEAIRQLEGDHLFADDRSPPRNSVSPPNASPRAMEVCNSSGNSPSEYMPPVAQMVTVRPPWSASCQPPSYKPVTVVDKPLALTTFSAAPSEPLHPPTPYHQTSATVVPVSTTVTSLKHHVLNRLARSNELEEQPINLEYRPTISHSPSPPPQHHHHHVVQHHHHPQIAHQQPPQQTTTISQFHLQQQQLRPGVIVVKHS